jgi:hypothetical protein
MRAFCPPLRETPLSPTNVRSPKGNKVRSLSRAQTSITCLYLFSSYAFPKRILFLTLALKLQGSWLAYAIRPSVLILPEVSGNSRSIVIKNELFSTNNSIISELKYKTKIFFYFSRTNCTDNSDQISRFYIFEWNILKCWKLYFLSYLHWFHNK